MGRQGWAFCFGLLVTAAGVAQPPSDSERYPPPPDLPGEVVSQSSASRPIATAAPMALRQRSADPAFVAPLPKGQPATYAPTATVTIAAAPNMPGTAVSGEMPAAMSMFHAATNCAPSGCGTCFENFCNWITFRSKPRPSGCYPSPYTPPLQAWFPCDPKRGGCGPKVGCAMPMTPIAVPTSTSSSEVLPVPATPMVGECPEKDVLSTFRPVSEGIGFAPGAAPMANPTTQIKQSTWRPR